MTSLSLYRYALVMYLSKIGSQGVFFYCIDLRGHSVIHLQCGATILETVGNSTCTVQNSTAV